MTPYVVESAPDTVRSGFLDPSASSVATIASGNVVSYSNTFRFDDARLTIESNV